MNAKKIDKDKIMHYWLESSDEDFETMKILYDSKKYTWSLFIGHLMIEKLLKAYFVQHKEEYPPYIHNLIRLAELSELSITKEQKTDLATITAFNINARYDDYKKSFQRKCTPEFTLHWIEKIKDLRQWIRKQIKT